MKVASVEGQTKTYHRHLAVEIDGQPCAAFVDGGNVFHSVISEKFFRRLGDVHLSRMELDSVGTASDKARLKVLGKVDRPLKLRIAGRELAFKFQPVVVQGLSMDVNIGGPFMKANRWDDLHSKGCIKIGDQEVPLQGRPHAMERKGTFSLNSLTLPPHSTRMVDLCVGDDQTSGEAVWHGPEGGLQAVVHRNRQGRFRVLAYNDTDEVKRITKGMRFGAVEEVDQEAVGIHHLHKEGSEERNDAYRRQIMKEARPDKISGGSVDPELEEKLSQDPDALSPSERRKYLVQKFELDHSPLLQDAANLERAIETLMEFWTLFSHDGSYGKTELIKFKILTKEGPPVKCRYRPIPPDLEGNLRRQLDRWLQEDVIEPSDSPWSSNLVPVKKKNGEIRWCVDWRRLNDVTYKDSWPMPTVQDTLSRLAGSRVFSSVDMMGAFHCIPVEKESRPLTSFATPFGTFQQKRLGFGLTNGPAAYCRLVERILRNIPPEKALGFMDDGIIHAPDVRTHCDNMRLTLSAYQEAGLRLSPEKCSFFKDKLIFLGHEISKDGVQPPRHYQEAVARWEMPVTKTGIRSFCGLTSYYRNHIPDYAAIAHPLTSVMGKTTTEEERKPVEVTKEMRRAFETLKRRLVSAPVLGFPYFSGPKEGRFILDTDFSAKQISGILSQIQRGKEVVIAYGSKKLNKCQSNYGSTKGELFAAHHFMQKYKYYIRFRNFLWRTDNIALKSIKTMEGSAAMRRWMAHMEDFDFEVQHRAGTKHVNADALSRGGYAEPPDPEGKEEEACLAITRAQSRKRPTQQEEPSSVTGGQISKLPRISHQVDLRQTLWERQGLRLEKDRLLEEQRKDPELKQVRQWLRSNTLPNKLQARSYNAIAKSYLDLLPSLEIGEDELIRYFWPNQDFLPPRPVVCLPSSMWTEIIKMAHAQGAHMAKESTLQRLKKSVFFPRMRAEIEHVLRGCQACQLAAKRPPDQRHTLVAPQTGFPWQVLHINLYGPLCKSRASGSRYLLTCRDAFTKWVEAFALPDITAATIAQKLTSEVFCRYGYPDQVHSDQGAQFTSGLFSAVLEELGILQTNTGGYNPKGNAQIERWHRDLGPMLAKMSEKDPFSWEDVLPHALYASRTTPCTTTKVSPYQALFGTDVRQPIDIIFGPPEDQDKHRGTNHADHVKKLRDHLASVRRYIRQNAESAIIRERRRYHAKAKTFLPGHKVWLYSPIHLQGVAKKLLSPWTGPWVVANDRINDVMVRITPDPSWVDRGNRRVKNSMVVSVDRLKSYHHGPPIPATKDHDLCMEGDEFAEFHRESPRGPRRKIPFRAISHRSREGRHRPQQHQTYLSRMMMTMTMTTTQEMIPPLAHKQKTKPMINNNRKRETGTRLTYPHRISNQHHNNRSPRRTREGAGRSAINFRQCPYFGKKSTRRNRQHLHGDPNSRAPLCQT